MALLDESIGNAGSPRSGVHVEAVQLAALGTISADADEIGQDRGSVIGILGVDSSDVAEPDHTTVEDSDEELVVRVESIRADTVDEPAIPMLTPASTCI